MVSLEKYRAAIGRVIPKNGSIRSKPRGRRWQKARWKVENFVLGITVIIQILLVLAGVEQNPGPVQSKEVGLCNVCRKVFALFFFNLKLKKLRLCQRSDFPTLSSIFGPFKLVFVDPELI